MDRVRTSRLGPIDLINRTAASIDFRDAGDLCLRTEMSNESGSFHRQRSAVATKLSKSQSLGDVKGVPQINLVDSEVKHDFDIDYLQNDG